MTSAKIASKCFPTPIGMIEIFADHHAIKKLIIHTQKTNPLEPHSEQLMEQIKEFAPLNLAELELLKYFNGTLKKFSVPTDPEGTEFQNLVWTQLCNIGYGETNTYQELSIKINSPKASRAVGNANRKNPIPILIPCHRVIQKNGALGGYSAGTGPSLKSWLIEHERQHRTSSKLPIRDQNLRMFHDMK